MRALWIRADHLNDAALIYAHGIEEGKKRVLTEKGIAIDALQHEPAPAALLFEIVRPLGFNPAQTKDDNCLACRTTGQAVSKQRVAHHQRPRMAADRKAQRGRRGRTPSL